MKDNTQSKVQGTLCCVPYNLCCISVLTHGTITDDMTVFFIV